MLGKRMNKEQKEIAKHYREEAARMENDRAAGVAGWLEFKSWDQGFVYAAILQKTLEFLLPPKLQQLFLLP